MAGTMSIGGLSSGLDTTAIIEQLMALEQRPIVLLQERQSLFQVKKNAWGDINTRLASLQARAKDLTYSSVFTTKKVTSGDEAYVTATADGDAVPATYELEVTALAKAHRIASDKQTSTSEDLNLSGTFKINGKLVTVVATDSLNEIRDKINALTWDGETDDPTKAVAASIVDGHLVIEAVHTGASNTISLTDENGGTITSGVAVDLGLVTTTGTIKNELQEAADAQFRVNGLAITRSTNTPDDVIEGVTLQLKKETTGPISVSIADDIDHTISKIKAFVDQYNSVADFMSTKLAKDGDLQGDSTLIRLQASLRQKVSDVVDDAALGSYDQFAAIGLEIDKYGKLSLNEEDFKEALAEDPDAVQSLVQQVGTRVSDHIETYVDSLDGIIPNRREMFGDQIEDIKDRIESLEERLAMREEQLIKQFTELEKALAQFQAQGDWLRSQIQALGTFATK